MTWISERDFWKASYYKKEVVGQNEDLNKSGLKEKNLINGLQSEGYKNIRW